MRDGLRRCRAFLSDFVGSSPLAGARVLALMLLGGLVEGAGLMLLVPILLLLSGGGDSMPMLAAWLPTDPAARLGLLLGAFVLLMLARGLILYARDLATERLHTAFVIRLRAQLLARLADARWERLAALPHGQVTQRATGDVQTSGAAAQSLAQALVAAIMLAAYIAVAAALSLPLAVGALLVLGLAAFASRPILRRARYAGVGVSEANGDLTRELLGLLASLKLTRAHQLGDLWLVQLHNRQQAVGDRQRAFVRQRSLTAIAFTSLSALAGGAVLLIGFVGLGLAPAVLVVILLVLARLTGPALQLQQAVQMFAHQLPAYEAVRRLSESLDEPAAPSSQQRPMPFGAITFDTVTCLHRRPADSTVSGGVRGVSLRLTPGSFVALTGSSGAGKTTLVDLLVGLLTPQLGTLSVGDTTLTPDHLAAWRARLSYVTQDAVLFHASVRHNLAWGAGRPLEDLDLAAALHLVGATPLVASLPDGLDTVIGERGALLSGGEGQRLALARALLRRPDLLILDEATNALDGPSERAVLTRLSAISPRPTILLVAHRLVNLDLCDRIIRMEAGRIVADEPRLAAKARLA